MAAKLASGSTSIDMACKYPEARHRTMAKRIKLKLTANEAEQLQEVLRAAETLCNEYGKTRVGRVRERLLKQVIRREMKT